MIASAATSLSLGIDKNDMGLLPVFLVGVGKCRSVKEWLISPSSLDEVFMHVVEVNRDVENADTMVAAEKEKEKKQLRLCKICGERPAATGGCAMIR